MLRIIFFPITAMCKLTAAICKGIWELTKLTTKGMYKFTKWFFKEAIKDAILGLFGL